MNLDDLPEDCGYNKVYKHQWKTGHYGIGITTINEINAMIDGRWGWHFEPFPDMDYNDDNWFEKQECIVSFESKWDKYQTWLSVKEVN